ncbi:hypothetical protein ACIG0D_27335 [Streptomyces sp. NPDC052773]|uniref:hypothetical protein n=1 Tax=Streptomyces sp. NPDC052773 TaxID=3365693 RepID=UPI0037D6F5CB
MNHKIHVTPWRSRRPALAAQFDWSCSCGRRASSPSPDRAAAEKDALRHAPPQNKVTRCHHC